MGAARGFIVWSDGPDRDMHMEGAGGVRSEDGGTLRFSFTPPGIFTLLLGGVDPPSGIFTLLLGRVDPPLRASRSTPLGSSFSILSLQGNPVGPTVRDSF